MSILDRAKTHFNSQEVKRIEVPEWPDESGQPTVIFSEPLTLNDRRVLSKAAKEDDMEFIVRLVIMKALTEDGKKVFDLSDKPVLMNSVDPLVITRIANEIASAPSVQDMLGN